MAVAQPLALVQQMREFAWFVISEGYMPSTTF
jgi:hypothetical protein